MMPVIPAKTPMLMAKMAPIFSFFRMLRGQMSFHGRSARTKSIAAEYPVGPPSAAGSPERLLVR